METHRKKSECAAAMNQAAHKTSRVLQHVKVLGQSRAPARYLGWTEAALQSYRANGVPG